MPKVRKIKKSHRNVPSCFYIGIMLGLHWGQIELSNTNMSAEMTTEERFSINFRQMGSSQKSLKTRKPKIKGQWTEKA